MYLCEHIILVLSYYFILCYNKLINVLLAGMTISYFCNILYSKELIWCKNTLQLYHNTVHCKKIIIFAL